MSGCLALAGLTGETLKQVGTSLPEIMQKALSATRVAVADKTILSPIDQMESYALARLESEELTASVKNAALNAQNHMAALFNTSLPGFGHSFYNIQDAAGEALAAGISSFVEALQLIAPNLTTGAADVGNRSLVAARDWLDLLVSEAFNAAGRSVYAQVNEIHDTLATVIQEQNAAAEPAQGEFAW